MTQPKRRGKCQICGFRWGLNRFGVLRQHWVYIGTEGTGNGWEPIVCTGSGLKPESGSTTTVWAASPVRTGGGEGDYDGE